MTEGPDGRRWYVVHSQPRREQIAAGHLAEQGYTVHLPTLRREIRHARRRRVVARPLFPRYLFVAVDVAAERWRPILGTRGVSALMMDGERPRPAPPGVVEALIAASDGQGGYDFSADLATGQSVRFLAGPFAAHLGRVVGLDESGRVAVLMELLGAERVVSAPSRDLLPTGD